MHCHWSTYKRLSQAVLRCLRHKTKKVLSGDFSPTGDSDCGIFLDTWKLVNPNIISTMPQWNHLRNGLFLDDSSTKWVAWIGDSSRETRKNSGFACEAHV